MTRREPFDLSLLGGSVERGYRRLRPEVERMPWEEFEPSRYPADVLAGGRRTWTLAAFQEHRTGAACAAVIQAMIEARVPIDLVAMTSRFPLDELVHVELCARLANAMGGAHPISHDPAELVFQPPPDLSPRMRCAEMVVRVFCVGEAVSIPILRAGWREAEDPLVKAVLGRIVRDEAAHGRIGWSYLDWIADSFTREEREHLRLAALDEMAKLEMTWRSASSGKLDPDAPRLGWMHPDSYLRVAHAALETAVIRPLAARGLYAP